MEVYSCRRRSSVRRVFDSGMAKIFNEKINYGVAMKDKYFRCRNNNDIVTRVPFGYAHVGTEIYFDRLWVVYTSYLSKEPFSRYLLQYIDS